VTPPFRSFFFFRSVSFSSLCRLRIFFFLKGFPHRLWWDSKCRWTQQCFLSTAGFSSQTPFFIVSRAAPPLAGAFCLHFNTIPSLGFFFPSPEHVPPSTVIILLISARPGPCWSSASPVLPPPPRHPMLRVPWGIFLFVLHPLFLFFQKTPLQVPSPVQSSFISRSVSSPRCPQNMGDRDLIPFPVGPHLRGAPDAASSPHFFLLEVSPTALVLFLNIWGLLTSIFDGFVPRKYLATSSSFFF